MLKQILSFTFIFCFAIISTAQNKEFLDKKFEMSNSQMASYYRISTEDPSIGLTKYETYYIENDSLQSKGYVNSKNPDRKSGTWQWFYPNGNKRSTRSYSNGRTVGNQTFYFEDGSLQESYSYNKNVKREMPYQYDYYKADDGRVLIEKGNGTYNGAYRGRLRNEIDSISGSIKNKLAEGKWKTFKNGKLILEEEFKQGVFISGIQYKSGKKLVYNDFYTKAVPEMSMEKFRRKLKANMKYYHERIDIDEQDYVEKLILLIDVNTDGTITNIRVQDGMGKGPDEVAIRAVKRIKGKWKPATLRTFPVKSTFAFPYTFESRGF